MPSSAPSLDPSNLPSTLPSFELSSLPSTLPSAGPSSHPSLEPSLLPSDIPSSASSLDPGGLPSIVLSVEPSLLPSAVPSFVSSSIPSQKPSLLPSAIPSSAPIIDSSGLPSIVPSSDPSLLPSAISSFVPSSIPSQKSSLLPSFVASSTPSIDPSGLPSTVPSSEPSLSPSAVLNFISVSLSGMPLFDLSIAPSTRSSVSPSASPFEQPSFGPTIDCSNDLDFRFEGDSLRTCDSYVAFKPVKRCEKIQPESGGKKVREFCPGACKKKCKKPRDEVTSAPSAVPNFDCSDDISFRFEGNPSRTCDSYVAIKPIKRCQKIQPESGGKKVRNFCPSVCKSNCKRRRGPCENLGSFRFEGNSSRTCDSYVAMKPIKRCAKIQPKSGGKKVSEFCPSTCEKKCKKPRGKCEDLITFKFQGNPEFTCDLYVAEKPFKRCKKEVEGTEDENGKLKKIRFFCPATCKRKCKTPSFDQIGGPSFVPISKPSPLPSAVPSSLPTSIPSQKSSQKPSMVPSSVSLHPSGAPSFAPSAEPRPAPTAKSQKSLKSQKKEKRKI